MEPGTAATSREDRVDTKSTLARGVRGGTEDHGHIDEDTRQAGGSATSGVEAGYEVTQTKLRVTKDLKKWRSLTTLPFAKHNDDFYLEVRSMS